MRKSPGLCQRLAAASWRSRAGWPSATGSSWSTAAKQRQLPESDWLERDSLVCCPDPEERVIMRIGRRRLDSSELT
jgi:hypothetical protein